MLTAVVSLDGAVVADGPDRARAAPTHGAHVRPLLLGVVGVANAASIAVPQGNPTNLVVIGRLHLSLLAFTGQMLIPGAMATLICASAFALLERSRLRGRYRQPRSRPEPLSRQQRLAVLALGIAALAAWTASVRGNSTVGAVRRGRVGLPAGDAMLVGAARPLARRGPDRGARDHRRGGRSACPRAARRVLADPAGSRGRDRRRGGADQRLPASVWVSSLLTSGPVAYAAVVGLAVGALAAPQGSIATLIAADLAGPDVARLSVRSLAPVALAALLVAIVALQAPL